MLSASINGPGPQSQFQNIYSLVADSQSNIYTVEFDQVRKITPAGLVTRFAGNNGSAFIDGPGSSAAFDLLTGIAITPNGLLLVADSRNSAIRTITTNGLVATLVGGPTKSGYADGTLVDAKFQQPVAVAVDANGNIYVVDFTQKDMFGYCSFFGDFWVRKITPSGVVSTLYKSSGFSFGTKIAVDRSGDIYLAITEFPRDPAYGGVLCPGVSVAPLFSYIQKLGPNGTATLWAGTNLGSDSPRDGQRLDARFTHMSSIAIDALTGSIFVSDRPNGAIRRISADGMVSTVVGQVSPANPASPTTLTLGPLPGLVPIVGTVTVGPQSRLYMSGANSGSNSILFG